MCARSRGHDTNCSSIEAIVSSTPSCSDSYRHMPDWAACVVPGATPRTWGGGTSASAVMPITCKPQRSGASDRCIRLATHERVVPCAKPSWRCLDAYRRRVAGQRHRGERNRQRHSHAAPLNDALGPGDRNARDISGRGCAITALARACVVTTMTRRSTLKEEDTCCAT